MLRSFSSGCENAIWRPAWRLGSTLVNGLSVAVRHVSHERLHAPAPHGSRWGTPVDENQPPTLTPRSPSSRLDGGVAMLDRPAVAANTGVNAPRLSPTRAAPASVPRRAIARSGFL